MAVFGISITKEMDWRGGRQEFSNVYHVNTNTVEAFPDQDVMNYLADEERKIHSNLITFTTARTWGPTDQGAAASVMREIIDLTGSGDATSSASLYREAAILITWPLGRYGLRNRPQYLRKWLHTMSLHGYAADGSSPLGAPAVVLTDYINRVTTFDPAIFGTGDLEICTAEGRIPTGPGEAYPYLEHRQLGR